MVWWWAAAAPAPASESKVNRTTERPKEDMRRTTKDKTMTTPKGQQDTVREARQEENKRGRGPEEKRKRQDDGRSTTRDKLEAAATEHLKKDNRKATKNVRRTGPKRLPQEEQRRSKEDIWAANFFFPTRESRKKRTTGGQGQDIGCWVVLSSCPASASLLCSSRSHVVMFTC